MTRSEAKRRLREAYPGRTVYVEVQDWHYPDIGLPHERLVFTAGVLPGPNGHACQQWTGRSIEEATLAALPLAEAEKETEASLDAAFAANEPEQTTFRCDMCDMNFDVEEMAPGTHLCPTCWLATKPEVLSASGRVIHEPR